jgi:hypothetical protein
MRCNLVQEGFFNTHDFCWEDHAYSLLQRFYPASTDEAIGSSNLLSFFLLPAGAPVLDNELKHAYDLTYHTFGSGKDAVDTKKFREAIWCVVWQNRGERVTAQVWFSCRHYTQRLYGVCNDHYEYHLVNEFTTIDTKAFSKKARFIVWLLC